MNITTKTFIEKTKINDNHYDYISLKKISRSFDFDLLNLPFTYRILLENLVRCSENDESLKKIVINIKNNVFGDEIFFSPSRVLMQDYTGVPAIADLAAMRDKMLKDGKNPEIINPVVPVSLVIDHSISVDNFSNINSLNLNVEKEFERNHERYKLLKWAQKSLKNFSLFPPGSGICHQINIEYLADIVSSNGTRLYLDSVVGTDSHTTMVNALSVLGWGVGGIEAEAVMLGQPISMTVPDVIGVKISGQLKEGLTATDLVLTITEKLRKFNVVGKFVEFFGNGIKSLSLSERSTISNMAPEYGATCGLFPIDEETIKYLEETGRSSEKINLITEYAKLQMLWHHDYENIKYNETLEINLNEITPSLAGPKRPQDRFNLSEIPEVFQKELKTSEKSVIQSITNLGHGSVCIAAITSCTNTSNPVVLIMAGLVAKKAVELGLRVPDWVKTSFAPGSKVVSKYLEDADLIEPLSKLGFDIVGYGCTTCIGNSGPLRDEINDEISSKDLNVCSVISGNRNFEGRIHPLVKSNFLASPPLVVIFALIGSVNINIEKDPISQVDGKKIFMKDLWPSKSEVDEIIKNSVNDKMYKQNYKTIFEGDNNWGKIKVESSSTFKWSIASSYIKKPPFLDIPKPDLEKEIIARPILLLGDSITTDHISPAGVIKEDSSAGKYLNNLQISSNEYNSFGSRRGNHEVMVRGTFANIRLKNEIVEQTGGVTKHFPSQSEDEVFNVAKKYEKENIPLVVIAGKEYGTGSSRDWAAKGTKLLGIKSVIAESFERIHRSNLVGMGVLPLQFDEVKKGDLNLIGSELFFIGDLKQYLAKPNVENVIKVLYSNQREKLIKVKSRIDTDKEISYFKHDGILPFVLRNVS